MLSIKIRFESSWTNSFYGVDDFGDRSAPLFTSGSQLSGSTKKLDCDPFSGSQLKDPHLKGVASRIPYLRDLQAKNPALVYRVPESFDNTVTGTLARLMGETRRLHAIRESDPDHLALRAFAGCSYHLDLESEYSMTTTLASYVPNDIQTGGAGVIENVALFSKNPDTLFLFGHLAHDINTLESMASTDEGWLGLMSAGQWAPQAPSELIDRLDYLAGQQAEVCDAAKKRAKADDVAYVTAFPNLSRRLSQALPVDTEQSLAKKLALSEAGKAAAQSVEAGALEDWSFAAAITVAKVRSLSNEDKNRLIETGALTKAGNIPGMAMTGAIGNITAKDMYKAASSQSMKSYSLPYRADIPVQLGDKKSTIDSGVIKKTGTLVINISDEALADEVEAALEAASVGPFHFGKKGVAFVLDVDRS